MLLSICVPFLLGQETVMNETVNNKKKVWKRDRERQRQGEVERRNEDISRHITKMDDTSRSSMSRSAICRKLEAPYLEIGHYSWLLLLSTCLYGLVHDSV